MDQAKTNNDNETMLIRQLELRVSELGPTEASELLEVEPLEMVVKLLQDINPHTAQDILEQFPPDERKRIIEAAPPEVGEQWIRKASYEEGTIGRLMESTPAIFSPSLTVKETIEKLRILVKSVRVTYGFVVDSERKLLGVIAMRDLLFSQKDKTLEEIMIPDPFFLRPEMEIAEAMKQVVLLHYPLYPVCNDKGILLGIVRGQMIFEEQAFEFSAQAGAMVGVEKEERLSTPWPRSLKARHPWLQLNLLTAFVAGTVVSLFQGTIDKLVILAVFLPVVAGQSGNTGCQALAVALRGLTLGDFKPGSGKALVLKEALLGLLNGVLVGISAAIGMFIFAKMQDSPHAWMLSLTVFAAMITSCIASGVCGALIPLTLKRFGADPATASSIFLTTATDVISMGTLLTLATLLAM